MPVNNSRATFAAEPDDPMKTYMCLICGYIYDEETGGAGKEDFDMVEV